jgi:hypothetical protein
MQSYVEIPDEQSLVNSRVLILNNDKTVMSCSSGSTFPSENLQIGTLCYRTDESNLYQCTELLPSVWKLIFDLNKTATNKEYVDGQVATKQSTVTGAASTVVTSNLAANRVLISNSAGKIIASTVITTTELGYLNSVSSNIQTQLNTKLNAGAKAADSDTVDGAHAGNASGNVALNNGVLNVSLNAEKWNGGRKTVSTAAPSGGTDGDVWFQYE